MSNQNHLYAVILAGGGGTRLWPKSRKETPKQFLKLIDDQRSMMQVAADRITKLVNWDRVIVVTNKIYYDEVQRQLPKVPQENIIAEPEKKDTALAMLVGALFAKSKDPEAIIMNAASDHMVIDEAEFVRVMKAATKVAAAKNYLVTVGITPTFATSALGYIKISEDLQKLDKGLSLFKVDSFTEKPNIATARAFISTGKYFWNANMYVWSAKSIKEAFAKHMPDLHEQVKQLDQLDPQEFHQALPKIYQDAESISIDYAISEKADNLVLIPGDFGWSDVGDWKVVYDLGKKDSEGNVIVGKSDAKQVMTINAHGNLVHTNNNLIALIGIKNMVVVDTGEILMICPKDRTQEVKQLVKKLKKDNRKEHL
jgi:mannose-1-phosphate guanylyltransferase